MGIKQEMPLTLVVYEDGTEEEARGYIWKVNDKFYFDKFAKGSRGTWVDRFNYMKGENVKSRREIWAKIGEDKFNDFKKEYAATYLQRVINYKILERDTTYSFENLVNILSQNLSPADREILDLWAKMREQKNGK